ncbi:MAG: hypothetical protein JKY23_02475, partial [Nitrospinaceae bacterium]|nr:hypothetical protein [Nitrospinaceae bacterium]
MNDPDASRRGTPKIFLFNRRGKPRGINRGNMVALVHSGAVLGIDGYPVEVEVNLSQGLPGMSIVGLPDAAVKESSDRASAAIRNT